MLNTANRGSPGKWPLKWRERYAEHKDDAKWVSCCMTMEDDGTKQRSLMKCWWDCITEDMKSMGLPQEDAQVMNKRRSKIKSAS